ncbi:unnamed protein product, partial [Prorocentrum cordatum]
ASRGQPAAGRAAARRGAHGGPVLFGGLRRQARRRGGEVHRLGQRVDVGPVVRPVPQPEGWRRGVPPQGRAGGGGAGAAQLHRASSCLSHGPLALDRAKRLPQGVAAALAQGRARCQGGGASTLREAQAATRKRPAAAAGGASAGAAPARRRAAAAAEAPRCVSKRRRVDKSDLAAPTEIPPHELTLNQLAQLIWRFAFY